MNIKEEAKNIIVLIVIGLVIIAGIGLFKSFQSSFYRTLTQKQLLLLVSNRLTNPSWNLFSGGIGCDSW